MNSANINPTSRTPMSGTPVSVNPAVGSPVNRALWFIESHFTRELTLDEIADVACVSRYHMSRVFAITMGCPIMRYVRGRRLTRSGAGAGERRSGHSDGGAGCGLWLS